MKLPKKGERYLKPSSDESKKIAYEDRAYNILVLEDERDDYELLVRFLEKRGLHCERIAHVKDELGFRRMVEQSQPWDILLADFEIPGCNVVSLIHWLHGQYPFIPAIILSGIIDEARAVLIMQAGASDFVSKSNLDRLIPAIHREIRDNRAMAARAGAEARASLLWQVMEAAEVGICLAPLTETASACDANPAWWQLLGIDAESGANLSLLDQLGEHPRLVHPSVSLLLKALDAQRPINVTLNVQRPEKKSIWVDVSISPVHHGSGDQYLMAVAVDRTAEKTAEQRLAFISHYDPLTQLPNRSLFLERCEQAIVQARRSQEFLGVAGIDIFQFQDINDSYGHEVGDALLKALAARLKAVLRAGDTVCRVGPDDFALILTGLERIDDFAYVAEKLAVALKSPFEIDGRQIQLKILIGMAVFPSDADSAKQLLENADRACRRELDQDEAGYQFYQSDMTRRARDRVRRHDQMRKALEAGEFRLQYQPQWDVQTGELIAVEALVRWDHPNEGLIGPDVFIPLAEESHFMLDLGEWVFEQALEDRNHWSNQDLKVPRVAINLSVRQLIPDYLHQTVSRMLTKHGVDGQALELEITESLLMQDVESKMEMLHALRELGVRLALDDFGTGYSSLAYLKQLPLDSLKIDRAFIKDVGLNLKDEKIVKAVVALAESLGLETVAEGVETEAQLHFFMNHGGRYVQGFGLFKPVNTSGIVSLLQALQKNRVSDALEGAGPMFLPKILHRPE